MSKIVIVFILSIVSLWGVEFHTYKEALEIQKKSNKIIMVDVVRNGCHYCEKMDKQVLQNPKFSKWLDKRFIIARINLDKEKLPKGMYVDFTPTFYFLNTKGEILKKIPGSWSIQDFKDLTEKIH